MIYYNKQKRNFLYFHFFALRKNVFFIGISLFFSLFTNGQNNTSYNANSIPIGGAANVVLGNNSLSLLSTGVSAGIENCAIGNSVLSNNIHGNSNVGIGYRVLVLNTSGSFNIGIGRDALYSTKSYENVGIGFGALVQNHWGIGNVAIGNRTLTNNINGIFNSAFGYNANVFSDNLTNATALGANAIVNASNTIQLGDANVRTVYAGVGTTAKLVTGKLQVTDGTIAAGNVLTSDGLGNATWQLPSGGGGSSTSWNITGNAGTNENINFIGTTDNASLSFRLNNSPAGKLSNAGGIFLGFNAGLNEIPVNVGNIGIGLNSLMSVNTGNPSISGNGNIALGSYTLSDNINGSHNTAIGYRALEKVLTESNSALGFESLSLLVNGVGNTAIGKSALNGLLRGNGNTAIGTDAGSLFVTILDQCTTIGSATMCANNSSNSTALGFQALVNTSNKIRLGDANVNIVEGPIYVTTSDGRFKNNISETDVKGLEFIKKLRPVVYNFDSKAFESFLTQAMPDSIRSKYMGKDFTKSTAIRQSGFIAQEVEVAANEVGYNFNGVHIPESKEDNYSLAYAQFVVPLVKSVQELSAQNTALRQEINEMKALIKESIASNKNNNSLNGSIKITEGEDMTAAKLYQNAPNPFNQSTIIKYNVPATAKSATLNITNMDGKRIKTFDLKNTNKTNIEINGGQLAAGSYIYSLVVDNVLIDSKQMILTSK